MGKSKEAWQRAPVRVLLVDDHKVVRVGLKTLLAEEPDLQVVGEAHDAKSAVSEAARLKPDLVVLDIRLPDSSGLEVCQRIKQIQPAVRVLILTSFIEDDTVLRAVAAGVDGYVLKEIDGPDLALTIRKVAAGEPVLDAKVTRRILDKARSEKNPLDALSRQEKRVVALLSEGKTNKEIGQMLGLEEGTTRNYLSRAMEKLGVSRRAEAAGLYVRWQRHGEG